jgi:predicted nucleic acid-binding Zn finger protein
MDTRTQDERYERARAALASGEYKITPAGEGAWSVVNGDNVPYSVTHEACTCKDYQNNTHKGVKCKHICAIRILFTTGGQFHMNDNDTTTTPNGWTRLYHPSGAQVTLPITYGVAGLMFAQVDAYITAGFQVDAPGLEEGEQKQEVVSVSRREASDGTPIVAFYLAHPKTVKKFLHAYLNRPEDIAAFEAATGLKLDAIPTWPGERDIDKDHKDAGKYIVQLPRPINLVWEVNPKWLTWSAEGGKSTGAIEPHKRILSRYDSATKPATSPLSQTETPSQPAASAPPDDPIPAPAPAALPERKYEDNTLCKDDPAERTAFDAYLKAIGKPPKSLESLRTWYRVATNGK